tara:strand:- start:252 stop:2024 length:1773 start_codon:yes stop_codon:yes gene_type:complete
MAAADSAEEGDAAPTPSAAADEALRMAMGAEDYESLARALEEHCALASEGMLVEARAMRDRLHRRRKKVSRVLRRAHAVEMEVQSGLSSLSLAEVTPPPPAAAAAAGPMAVAVAPPVAAIALTLDELATATGGFGERKLIGSGGYGRVFKADALPSLPPEALPPRLRHLPVAVKRAKSGVHNLADLRREVSVLQLCSHPHLLPLLGYYLEQASSPCLVFPLMRGGSFADRLWPSEVEPERMQRLGLATPLSPLGWYERLRILHQATGALLYLHTLVPGGKGVVTHRDFKPENILLDDQLNAYLADTGFAKMDVGPEASKQKSASNALYLTRGYLDPSVIEGGEYSAITDGWALGITLLVALSGRSPLSIFDKCEEAFDDDFADIEAKQLAEPAANWPPDVATAIKELVRSASRKCLCHQSKRKKLALADALDTLSKLVGEGEGGSVLGGVLEEAAPSTDRSSSSNATAAAGYSPTPLSIQVRETRKAGDAQKGIKDNMLLAFNNLLPRLDAVYTASAPDAPEGFEERINFWHRECGMRTSLRDQLHTLRIWANAARHHDDERWRRDGPANEAEASRLISGARTALEALER